MQDTTLTPTETRLALAGLALAWVGVSPLQQPYRDVLARIAWSGSTLPSGVYAPLGRAEPLDAALALDRLANAVAGQLGGKAHVSCGVAST